MMANYNWKVQGNPIVKPSKSQIEDMLREAPKSFIFFPLSLVSVLTYFELESQDSWMLRQMCILLNMQKELTSASYL